MNRTGVKAALIAIKLAVSGALLWVLFSRADLSAMATQFRHMNLAWMFAALLTYGLMLVVSAWRWQLLLQVQSIPVGFGHLTNSFLVATFFNNFLPSNIGGDVVRVADTAPYAGSKTVATTIVLIDRVLGLIALLAVAAGASALATIGGIPLAGVGYIWIGLVAVLGALLFVLRFPERFARIMHRAAGGRGEGIQARLLNLLGAIARFAQEPRRLAVAFAGALAVQFLLVVFYMCAAHSLAVPFPLMAASVVVPVSLAVQMVPLSINGFGVREAVFAFFFASLGLNVGTALTLSLGSAALIMLFSLTGGAVFLLRRGRPSPSSGVGRRRVAE
jgi:glycosyltransferase 2 family protein